ncbi:helix-turn-helix transcriptional regulator [uncultured Thiodictyon sp.]|nr:helix-turn-helix transcriptional regulator [uncultured Thiodictyon sp.]
MGSSLDSFLEEEKLLAQSEAIAIKRVIAFRLEQEMAQQQLTKTDLARRMGASRSALDRLLDPDNTSVTLLRWRRPPRRWGGISASNWRSEGGPQDAMTNDQSRSRLRRFACGAHVTRTLEAATRESIRPWPLIYTYAPVLKDI